MCTSFQNFLGNTFIVLENGRHILFGPVKKEKFIGDIIQNIASLLIFIKQKQNILALMPKVRLIKIV